MRTLILVTGAALALAACRNNDHVDNTANVDENLSAENIVSNDVTAIDAVTGADANMAADVAYSNATLDNATSNLPDDVSNAPASTSAKKPSKAAPTAPANSSAETNSTNAE